jgi:error-prone DNA polymerase
VLERLIHIFGRENVYVELQRHYDRRQEAINQQAITLAESFRLPVLATNGVRYASTHQREILDVFTCIRNHRTLATAGRLLSNNSDRYLKTSAQMARLFHDVPEAIANTIELSRRLQFTMKDLGYQFPKYAVGKGETMASFLRKKTEQEARHRFRPYDEKSRQQIERELKLIEKLGLEGYFLIVWDIVQFCLKNNILVQGRGSAANSAVCYALGITAVDPVRMDLLFERFLSEERGEWPDIDLDLPSGDQRIGCGYDGERHHLSRPVCCAGSGQSAWFRCGRIGPPGKPRRSFRIQGRIRHARSAIPHGGFRYV